MARRWVLLFGLVVLLAYLSTGLYQVKPGEVAVVRRFGRVLEQPRFPGLNVGLPWGLDRVDRVPVDERRQITVGFAGPGPETATVVPAGQVLTGDNNLIDVTATIYYRVDGDRPEAIVQYVLNRDRVEGVLARAGEVALAATLAEQKVGEVLLGRARHLESSVQQRLVQTLRPYQLGVVIDSVNLTYVQPPAELADVFRMVNEAKSQKAQAETAARADRDTVTSSARTEASKVRTQAQAAAAQQVSRARAEAASFLALWREYRDNTSDPQNAILTLYLKEMQAILARFQVRTISDPNTNHTIVVPLPDR
jgi:membrane protease subunit HflK